MNNEQKLAKLREMAKNMPILFVEDDAGFQTTIAQKLRGLGFIVTIAGDGWAGSLEFGKQSYQLVITDFSMPGKNGAELTREIRAKSPDTQVIILTSLQQHEEVKATFNGDNNVYLVAKGGIDRPVIGLEDALFMTVARIDTRKSRYDSASSPPKPAVSPPATQVAATPAPSPTPRQSTIPSLGSPGSAVAKLRQMREAREGGGK